uniref:Uncharacterized protein n=1 Tax=Cannabis sativa TaxID=3483 RepID=A0A803NI93_CANSA
MPSSMREYPSPKGIGDKAALKMLNIVLAFHPGQLAGLGLRGKWVHTKSGTPIPSHTEASRALLANSMATPRINCDVIIEGDSANAIVASEKEASFGKLIELSPKWALQFKKLV